MATVYPGAIDSYSTLVDNVDDVLAADMNDRGSAIVALETKLGGDNSSVNTTVDYFLKHASGAYRTHTHDGTSDDGSTTIGPLTALTIANNIDVGNYDFHAKTFTSDVATGTSPFTVSSTTVVDNLNADTVDGHHASSFVETTGTQTIAGVKTFSSIPILPSSDPTSDNQAARKAYVDANIIGFGAREDKSNNTVYLAATDGFVEAYGVNEVTVKTDASNPPNTIVQICGSASAYGSVLVPILSGKYWKVTGAGVVTWIPLGT